MRLQMSPTLLLDLGAAYRKWLDSYQGLYGLSTLEALNDRGRDGWRPIGHIWV